MRKDTLFSHNSVNERTILFLNRLHPARGKQSFSLKSKKQDSKNEKNLPFVTRPILFLRYFAAEIKKRNVNLIIDIGNTVAKLAVFDGDEVVEVLRGSNHSLDWLSMLCNKYPIERGIIASVITLSNTIRRQLAGVKFEIMELSHQTPVPVKNLYRTPQTLGMDRLAAVVGAQYLCPGKDLLVIDAGTALTYEFIDAAGCYHGGNISPGIYTRFKALNACCDKLPLIERGGDLPDFGYDTETAIRSGVIKGMEFEIAGYITLMQKKYPELLVFLTGGDKFSFDTNLKSIIFADRFLVLKGLNRILNYNVKKESTH